MWLLLVLPLFPVLKPAFGHCGGPRQENGGYVTTEFDRVFVFEEDSREPLHEIATIAARPA